MGIHIHSYIDHEPDKIRESIDIRSYENEIVIDCRKLGELEQDTEIEVNGSGDEPVGFEKVPPIVEVPMEDVRMYRYNIMSTDDMDIYDGYKKVVPEREEEYIYPTVWENEDGEYELIDGHIRANLMKDEGADEIPVHIKDVSEREAMFTWATNHFPNSDNSAQENVYMYRKEQQEQALELLRQDWPESVLKENDRLKHAMGE